MNGYTIADARARWARYSDEHGWRVVAQQGAWRLYARADMQRYWVRHLGHPAPVKRRA